jgi:hypothetical protein
MMNKKAADNDKWHLIELIIVVVVLVIGVMGIGIMYFGGVSNIVTIPGFGTGPKETNLQANILGNNVHIIKDKDGRCYADFGAIGKYGLKNGQLEFFENNKWKNVNEQIPNTEQINLREKKDNLVSREVKLSNNFIKINLIHDGLYYSEDSSNKGYLLQGSTNLYALNSYSLFEYNKKENSKIGNAINADSIKQVIINALKEQKLILWKYSSSGAYLLIDSQTGSPSIPGTYSYALDSSNIFYNFNNDLSGKTIWNVYNNDASNYFLYSSDKEWSNIKQRKEIKQGLTTACGESNEK